MPREEGVGAAVAADFVGASGGAVGLFVAAGDLDAEEGLIIEVLDVDLDVDGWVAALGLVEDVLLFGVADVAAGDLDMLDLVVVAAFGDADEDGAAAAGVGEGDEVLDREAVDLLLEVGVEPFLARQQQPRPARHSLEDIFFHRSRPTV